MVEVSIFEKMCVLVKSHYIVLFRGYSYKSKQKDRRLSRMGRVD